MSNQTPNIHYLDKMMSCNSLNSDSGQFPVTVCFNQITMEQANLIIARSHGLYDNMEKLKHKIYDLYGQEQTVKLMDNFDDIISYSSKVLTYGSGSTFEEYFLKLESFCGQIENIIKMIRYYYVLFDKRS